MLVRVPFGLQRLLGSRTLLLLRPRKWVQRPNCPWEELENLGISAKSSACSCQGSSLEDWPGEVRIGLESRNKQFSRHLSYLHSAPAPLRFLPPKSGGPQQCFVYLVNLASLAITFRTSGCCVSWGHTSQVGTYEVPTTGATLRSQHLLPAHNAGPPPGLLWSFLRRLGHMLLHELTTVLSR